MPNQATKHQVETNLKLLIRQHGGKMFLSNIKDRYREKYNASIPLTGSSSLKDWIQHLDFITMEQPDGKKHQWCVTLRDFHVHTSVDERLRSLLKEHTELDISVVKREYEQKYPGENFPCTGSIKKWLESFPFLLVQNKPGKSEFQWMVRLRDQSMSIIGANQDSQTKTIRSQSPSIQPSISYNHEDYSNDDDDALESENEDILLPTRLFTNMNDLNLDSQLCQGKFNVALHWVVHGDEELVSMLIIRFAAEVVVVDCQMISSNMLRDILNTLLHQNHCRPIIHNMYEFKHALKMKIINIQDFSLKRCFDMQLAMEFLMGDHQSSIHDMGTHLNISTGNASCKKSKIPLRLNDLNVKSSIKHCSTLWEAGECIMSKMTKREIAIIVNASKERASMNQRDLRFNLKDNYSLGSLELLNQIADQKDISTSSKLVVHNEIQDLIDPLPNYMKEHLYALGTECISDISIDKGRPPCCWIKGKREIIKKRTTGLFSNQESEEIVVVEQRDLNQIMARLGKFGDDNRAGMDRSLHRISCIRNRYDTVIGLTMRVGRHVDGNADIILDLLFRHRDKSILFLGEPGSGKTTIVREVTKLLAENHNVCIVDTSNEIAGGGDVPHAAIGNARRLMVKNLKDQSKVMVECVQNHTPETIVIDEIGRPPEVDAARTAKHRGVRIVASAHGDLRNLLKNKELRGLLGGLETVTIGDDLAKEEAKKKGLDEPQKSKTTRAAVSVFEIIVELKRGKSNEWKIVMDSNAAVDTILQNELYKAQRRTRDPESGQFSVENILC